MNRRTFLAGAVLAAAAMAAKQAPAGAHLTGARAPSRAAATAIAYARAQLGKPYEWGGPATGTPPWPAPGGFDCSGLVMEAYAAAGVSIPRTSEDQWAQLPHVSSPEPGDLIFYAGADGTVTSPGHVVLYVGRGQAIQAYATGFPVEVSSLASMDAGALTGYARP